MTVVSTGLPVANRFDEMAVLRSPGVLIGIEVNTIAPLVERHPLQFGAIQPPPS